MDPQTKAEFEKLQSKSANKTCIDCNTFNPQWASVNNGCFMCIKCAGNHRSMGVHITFVRSVSMDGWSNVQLARMKHGGNAKLKRFWSQQKFPKNLTPKQRLNNTAMDKYREHLLGLAKGKQVRDIAFIGYTERLETPNRSFSNLSVGSNGNSSVASNKMEGFGNTDYNPNQNNNNNDSWNDFGLWASSMAAKTSAVASDFASKSKTAAVNLSSKASEKAANLKTKLEDEEYQANLKKNAAETWSKTTTTLSSWWSTAATSMTNVVNEAFNENKSNDNNPPAFYNKDSQNNNRKKMAALSSDQYFSKTSYGSSTNQHHNDNPKQSQSQHINEDILGMDSNAKIDESQKKCDVDKVAPPFPKNTPPTKPSDSDDFDDWGFGEEGIEKKRKKSDVEPVDIMQAIAGVEENNMDSLLDFNENINKMDKKKEIEKDGNSSDDLDAFFDDMEKEKVENDKKKEGNDMLDLLGSHGVNKEKDDGDDWGWN